MKVKKIEYIITDFITSYIKENYPLYVKFLTKFGNYLDENNYGKIINIDDNFDPYTTFSELLNLFVDEFFTEVFDFDIYDLTDNNKKRFLDLSVRINKLKGLPQSFQVLLQSLVNFTYATSSGNINVDDVGILTVSDLAPIEQIFQYYISSTSDNIFYADKIKESVHPAGMLQVEFIDYSKVFGFYEDPEAYGFGLSEELEVGGFFSNL